NVDLETRAEGKLEAAIAGLNLRTAVIVRPRYIVEALFKRRQARTNTAVRRVRCIKPSAQRLDLLFELGVRRPRAARARAGECCRTRKHQHCRQRCADKPR